MYGNLPNLVLAFHGCDEETYKKVLYDHQPLLPSINSYDWLGNGIYFWENSFPRAQEWAVAYCERSHKKYPDKEKKRPAVIGAVISLGHCLNLTDYGSSEVLKNGYEILAYELCSCFDFNPFGAVLVKICCHYKFTNRTKSLEPSIYAGSALCQYNNTSTPL